MKKEAKWKDSEDKENRKKEETVEELNEGGSDPKGHKTHEYSVHTNKGDSLLQGNLIS